MVCAVAGAVAATASAASRRSASALQYLGAALLVSLSLASTHVSLVPRMRELAGPAALVAACLLAAPWAAGRDGAGEPLLGVGAAVLAAVAVGGAAAVVRDVPSALPFLALAAALAVLCAELSRRVHARFPGVLGSSARSELGAARLSVRARSRGGGAA